MYFFGLTGKKLATFQCGYNDQTGGNGQFWSQVENRNLYFGRKLMRSAGVTVVTDRVGSVRANSNGERMNYFPYGEERTSTADGREKFGTYFRDSVANGGLDYADQRYYSNASGRFMTSDPYAATSSSASDPSTPGSWNRYAYVQGDPINLGDPHGRVGEKIGYAIPLNQLAPAIQRNPFCDPDDLICFDDGGVAEARVAEARVAAVKVVVEVVVEVSLSETSSWALRSTAIPQTSPARMCRNGTLPTARTWVTRASH